MYKKLGIVSLFCFNILSAMEGQTPQAAITTPKQLLTKYLPPLQKMSDCRNAASDRPHWFCTDEEKDAFRKEIAGTEFYKEILRDPNKYAHAFDELSDGVWEYNISALTMCCEAAPVKDCVLSTFFDTNGCCQFRLSPLNYLLGSVFFYSAALQYKKRIKELQGIAQSWQKKKVLVEMLQEAADKKNK